MHEESDAGQQVDLSTGLLGNYYYVLDESSFSDRPIELIEDCSVTHLVLPCDKLTESRYQRLKLNGSYQTDVEFLQHILDLEEQSQARNPAPEKTTKSADKHASQLFVVATEDSLEEAPVPVEVKIEVQEPVRESSRSTRPRKIMSYSALAGVRKQRREKVKEEPLADDASDAKDKNWRPGAAIPQQQKTVSVKITKRKRIIKIKGDRRQNGKSLPLDNVYGCPCCLEVSESYDVINRHLAKHDDVIQLPDGLCVACDQLIPVGQRLTHTRQHILQLKQCGLCGCSFRRSILSHGSCPRPLEEGFTFSDKYRIKPNGLNSKELYQCLLCAKDSVSFAAIIEHIRKHTGQFKAVCAICQEGFVSSHAYQDHLKLHDSTNRFQCEHCGSVFDRLRNYRLHMARHDGINSVVCDVCGAKFSSKLKLNEHSTLHTGEKPFMCSFCGKMFRLERNKNTHETYVHRSRDGEMHKCGHCRRLFRKEHNLRAHEARCAQKKMAAVEGEVAVCDPVDNGEPTTPLAYAFKYHPIFTEVLGCVYCGFVGSNPADVLEHVMSEHQPLVSLALNCKFCDFAQYYPDMDTMADHIINTHLPRCWRCNDCFWTVASQDKPTRHFVCKREFKLSYGEGYLAYAKDDGLTYACCLCDLQFQIYGVNKFTKDSYLWHARSHDVSARLKVVRVSSKTSSDEPAKARPRRIRLQGMKTFTCQYCQKVHISSVHLREHEYTHTGQKPYKCDICQKGFRQTVALKMHRLLHTDSRPFVCELCGKGYCNRLNLEKHRKVIARYGRCVTRKIKAYPQPMDL